MGENSVEYIERTKRRSHFIMVNKISKVMLRPAKCGLDLGDGSERAEYVDQDYILQTLGRPHRNINIMYTYYPKDKEWPAKDQ